MLKPFVADVITTVSIYFNFSSEMLSRTSSQICGRWYLPMFLLRDGLLALLYRTSFMVLKRFWSSLPSMVKLSIVTSWPEMLWWSYMGLSESYKNICKQYGIDVHLKGGQTIKDHPMSPKDKDPINKKVGSYTGISVTGLIVMMNILVSQLEILKRGWRNISRPYLPYMTIITSLVMMSLLTILPYWGERTKTS